MNNEILVILVLLGLILPACAPVSPLISGVPSTPAASGPTRTSLPTEPPVLATARPTAETVGHTLPNPLLLDRKVDGPLIALAWSPDGRQLASLAGDDTLQIWDLPASGLE